MLNSRIITLLAALATISAVAYAETDIETIRSMREENAHMVRLIDNYLNDRAKIPADYQAASDKEFLKKARMERWNPHSSTSSTPKSTTATKSTTGGASKSTTTGAKSTGASGKSSVSKPAAKSAPTPAPKPKPLGREY